MKAINKDRRALYRDRQEKGLCPRCGKKKQKSEKHSNCDDCRAFFRSYNQKNAAENNDARKAIYAERKKNRQCPRCGKKHRAGYTKIMCKKCLDKSYSYLTG